MDARGMGSMVGWGRSEDRTGWQRVFFAWWIVGERKHAERKGASEHKPLARTWVAVRRNRWEGSTYEGRSNHHNDDGKLPFNSKDDLFFCRKLDFWLLRIWVQLNWAVFLWKWCCTLELCVICVTLGMLLFWFFDSFFATEWLLGFQ